MRRVAASFAAEEDSSRDGIAALADGWLFERDGRLTHIARTWSAARRTSRQGRFTRQWLPLLAETVAFEGDRIVTAYVDALLDAWHQGNLDPLMVLRYVAHRIGDARFTSYERRTEKKTRVRPVVLAEEGLAALMVWIVERIDEEIAAGTLRAEASSIILPTLAPWLLKTNSAVVHDRLLQTLTLIDRWDHALARPTIVGWIDSRAHGELKSPIHMAALDRTGDLAADNDRVRLMIARASAFASRGSDLRTDIEKWVVRWADSGTIEPHILADFARELLQWIMAEQTTFEWIARAARIRSSARLTNEVIALEPIAGAKSLGNYIVARLHSLPAESARLWPAKRNAFFEHLAVFAADLDFAERHALASMIDPAELTPDGRDGAVVLAVHMLHSGGNDNDDWMARLEQLVALGATGRGALAGHIHHGSVAFQRELQSNLLEKLARGVDTANTAPVAWIAATIRETRGPVLHELEYALCALLMERNRAFAIAAADALYELSITRPDVIERNQHALQRARRVVCIEDRPYTLRPSSRFRSVIDTIAGGADAHA